jgi:hypothetical protein
MAGSEGEGRRSLEQQRSVSVPVPVSVPAEKVEARAGKRAVVTKIDAAPQGVSLVAARLAGAGGRGRRAD